MNECLTKAEWQRILFEDIPQRAELLNLEHNWDLRSVPVHVERNHAFEPVASIISPYAAFGDWMPEFTYSHYDDSLSFGNRNNARIVLVWLDCSHYKVPAQEWTTWFRSRLRVLRSETNAVILVALLHTLLTPEQWQERLSDFPGIFYCDLGSVVAPLGAEALSERTRSITGTQFSNKACILLAREFGCRWFYSAVFPSIKSVVVDLDHTIYQGVLGEEGPAALKLSPLSFEIQNTIKELGKNLLLNLISKNDEQDVAALFETRDDFPLRYDDFFSKEISWQSKSMSMQKVAQQMRIDYDSILFMDDNPGELMEVSQNCPNIRTLYSDLNSPSTLLALRYFPGIFRWLNDSIGGARLRDLRAEQQRAEFLRETSTTSEYFSQLGVTLKFELNASQDLQRIYELSQKTNQFNTSLNRLSLVELHRRMNAAEAAVVSAKLSDTLCDSGLIGVITGLIDQSENVLRIDELCISCRALGRNVEDVLITQAIQMMPQFQICDSVDFCTAPGPRNKAAREWLAKFTGAAMRNEPQSIRVPAEAIRSVHPPEGLRIEKDSRN